MATTRNGFGSNSFGARADLSVGGRSYEIFRLDRLPGAARLPYSLKVLLENMLRHEDGVTVRPADIEALAGWDADAEPDTEIAFAPARILMQDFTGRAGRGRPGRHARRHGRPRAATRPRVNPLIPAELVIDHSIIADVYGTPDAFVKNAELEFQRNEERYRFLRWGQGAFDTLRVVPPNTGICHQVNLEYLARVVFTIRRTGEAYPDTLLGTDSHTTMINGLGVLGWGVGGIEAEAAMLGQPVSMLIPRVVGFQLTGALPEGSTATDLVLTVTEMLRKHGVVGKFVEFYGEGVATVPARQPGHHRQHVARVRLHLRHLPDRRRDPALPGAHRPAAGADRPGRGLRQGAGPVARPVPRAGLLGAAQPRPVHRRAVAGRPGPAAGPGAPRRGPGVVPGGAAEGPGDQDGQSAGRGPPTPRAVTLDDGTSFDLDHGHVVIAAITSCTNTSNPSVMLAAGLLAQQRRREGSDRQALGEDHPGPRLQGRHGLLRAGRAHARTWRSWASTWSASAAPPASATAGRCCRPSPTRSPTGDLAVVSVLSGNRNFEGRISPDVRMNYLASPPLVVAYALAGTMDVDLVNEPARHGHRRPARSTCATSGRRPRRWPRWSSRRSSRRCSRRPTTSVFEGDERWQQPGGPDRRRLRVGSTTRPTCASRPYFDGMTDDAGPPRRRPRGPGPGHARRQRHHRPHLARPATSAGTARPAAG